MKQLRKISRKEMKTVNGSGSQEDQYATEDLGGSTPEGCYVRLYMCPGQGLARLSPNGQKFTCC